MLFFWERGAFNQLSAPLLLIKKIYRNMYNKNTDKDLVSAGVKAGLGAGIVTSFAVSQGQNPLMALAITAIAALFGVICHQQALI